jgi:hypothetical protein
MTEVINVLFFNAFHTVVLNGLYFLDITVKYN